MRREELYLRDIVEAANHIAGFIAGFDPPAFQESEQRAFSSSETRAAASPMMASFCTTALAAQNKASYRAATVMERRAATFEWCSPCFCWPWWRDRWSIAS